MFHKRAFLPALCVFFCVCLLGVFIVRQTQASVWNEQEAEKFAESYLDGIIEKGPASVVDDCYFSTETEREMFQDSKFFYTGYEIKEICYINDGLYALTVELEKPTWDQTDEEQETVYNFVARLDGKTYYINNVRNIPESVQEGLDKNKFVNADEDELTLEDIQDIQMDD